MEPLEQTTVPWAQGVGRSNRPAPTNRIRQIEPNLGGPSRTFDSDPWANEFVTSDSPTLPLNSFTPTEPTSFNGSNQLTYQGATYVAGNQTAIGGYTFGYDAEN